MNGKRKYSIGKKKNQAINKKIPVFSEFYPF